MELIALFVFLWLIGCAFPSSGQSYGPDFRDVAVFLSGVVVFISLVFAWGLSVVGIIEGFDYLGIQSEWVVIFALFAPIALPMLVAGIINWHAERKAIGSEGLRDLSSGLASGPSQKD
jgi:hypothetical protein